MKVLSFCLYPFVWIWSWIRCFLKKDDFKRRKERLGIASIEKKEGDWIWFHGASVGEIISLEGVIKEYQKHFSNNILISTTTITGQKTAKRLFPTCTVQYIPYDLWFFIDRFLSYWNPLWVCFVDSEIWPCLIKLLHKKNIYFYIINARLSDKSYFRWNRFPFICKIFFSKIRCAFTPSIEMSKRFLSLGTKCAIVFPNLKFFSPKLPVCDFELLKKWVSNRPVWIAASTHEGEEDIMVKTHQNLQKTISDLCLILIPRHPTRAQNLHKTFSNSTLWSKRDENASILINDQLGNLGMYYNLETIVVMGKTFSLKGGGHNPIEPLLFKNLLIFGPDMSNFKDVITIWGDDAITCYSVFDLAQTIEMYIVNQKLREQKVSNVYGRLESIRKEGLTTLVEELGR